MGLICMIDPRIDRVVGKYFFSFSCRLSLKCHEKPLKSSRKDFTCRHSESHLEPLESKKFCSKHIPLKCRFSQCFLSAMSENAKNGRHKSSSLSTRSSAKSNAQESFCVQCLVPKGHGKHGPIEYLSFSQNAFVSLEKANN